MDYDIVLENFEGPLDLLLKLIDKAKIDIYDIPISEITEQYISFIYTMEDLNLEIASDFLIMASTLLEIKSRTLLPIEKDVDEEEEDPREELVLRLLAYKKFKEAALELKEYKNIESGSFYKPGEDLSFYEDIEENIDFYNLKLLTRALNNILRKRGMEKKDIDIKEIKREEYSIKECLEDILEKVNKNANIKFTDLFYEDSSKSEIITYFLSVLELTKQKAVFIFQDEAFTDLFISKRDDEVYL